MAKAVFLSLPLAGHINPSLPLVRELAARGEEVVYFATDPYEQKIRASNAAFRRYRNHFLSDLHGLPDHLHELSWLLMRTTEEVLGSELNDVRDERPDYLITDSVAPWGQWLAKIMQIPVVTSICTFAVNRHVLKYAAAQGARPKSFKIAISKIRHMGKAALLGRELKRRYGVSGPQFMGIAFGSSDLNVVYTSRQFQPCAETFSEQFLFIGPSVTKRPDSVEFPWDQVHHPTILYVSLGTLFNTDAAFYRKCFEAFGGRDLQVILSIGTSVPLESLGAVPENFVVRDHVPQLEVLSRASAFVTHGGMNSVNESLSFGVPMVCIPQMSEQELVARRVETLGAGLCLAKEKVTPEEMWKSVERLLTDAEFREQAEVLGESFAAAGGVSRAADTILQFTRR